MTSILALKLFSALMLVILIGNAYDRLLEWSGGDFAYAFLGIVLRSVIFREYNKMGSLLIFVISLPLFMLAVEYLNEVRSAFFAFCFSSLLILGSKMIQGTLKSV